DDAPGVAEGAGDRDDPCRLRHSVVLLLDRRPTTRWASACWSMANRPARRQNHATGWRPSLVQVGGYVSADGEQGGKDEQGHFLATDVTVTRNGHTVR